MTTTTMDGSRARERTHDELSLEDLAKKTIGELTRIYREARVPASLEVLHGAPKGRMLTVVGPLGRGPVRRAIASLARASFFPWGGKNFEAFNATDGRGINRVRLLGEAFPFDLKYGVSKLDGLRCVVLDYDQPENPWIMRQIHDELREVSPGLFLGPAMAKTRTEPKLVLFFAIDHR
jgi:hypothetical protein